MAHLGEPCHLPYNLIDKKLSAVQAVSTRATNLSSTKATPIFVLARLWIIRLPISYATEYSSRESQSRLR